MSGAPMSVEFTQHPHTPQESDMTDTTRTITVRLDPELRDLLTEIRDRLPEPTRCEEGSSEPAPVDLRRVNVTITDVYAVPSDYGFLRINVGPEGAVIDQNARNVTVTDVEPAPADVDPYDG